MSSLEAAACVLKESSLLITILSGFPSVASLGDLSVLAVVLLAPSRFDHFQHFPILLAVSSPALGPSARY